MISESVGKFLLQCPRAGRHHSQNSFLSVEGLAVGTGMPTGGLLRGGIDLAVKAIVVRAPTENLIARAFYFTLADNDVAVAVYLCGVHGVPLSVVNDCSA